MSKILPCFALLVGLGMLQACDPTAIGTPEAPHPNFLSVEFIDVGQGNACLLRRGTRSWLFDAGPDSAGILDSLRVRGIDSLAGVLVSHGHRDHGGGLLELLGHIQIGQIWVSQDTEPSWTLDSLRQILRVHPVPLETLFRGDSLPGFGAWHPRVLWPERGVLEGGNSASLVVLVGDGESSFLSVGDIGFAEEAALLAREPTLQARLLQVGHHGSATSSSLRWLGQLSPDYAVINVGLHNDYGHPTLETLQRLAEVLPDSSHLLRTDQNGTVGFLLAEGFGVWRAEAFPEKW